MICKKIKIDSALKDWSHFVEASCSLFQKDMDLSASKGFLTQKLEDRLTWIRSSNKPLDLTGVIFRPMTEASGSDWKRIGLTPGLFHSDLGYRKTERFSDTAASHLFRQNLSGSSFHLSDRNANAGGDGNAARIDNANGTAANTSKIAGIGKAEKIAIRARKITGIGRAERTAASARKTTGNGKVERTAASSRKITGIGRAERIAASAGRTTGIGNATGLGIGQLVFFGGIALYLFYIYKECIYDLEHLDESAILLVIWAFASFVLALAVQTVLHELGHLVCGLFSGYAFSSFRIGPLMWQKWKGHLQFHFVRHPATLGQCLMVPPKPVSKETFSYPYVLYNLGGVLFNLITAGISFLAFLQHAPNSMAAVFLAALAVTGLIMACVNGIPAKSGLVFNDGTNLKEIRDHPAAAKGFWVQLMAAVYANVHKGPEYYEETWFTQDLLEDVSSPVSTSALLLYVDKLYAAGDYEKLCLYLQSLPYRSSISRMPMADRALLDMEVLFCLLMLQKNDEAREWMNQLDSSSIQDLQSLSPSIYRTIWAVSALKKDVSGGRASMIEFRRLTMLYRTSSPEKMKLEENLMALAEKRLDPKKEFHQMCFGRKT